MKGHCAKVAETVARLVIVGEGRIFVGDGTKTVGVGEFSETIVAVCLFWYVTNTPNPTKKNTSTIDNVKRIELAPKRLLSMICNLNYVCHTWSVNWWKKMRHLDPVQPNRCEPEGI